MFQRHQRVSKAGTLNVNRGYLSQQILPHFAGRPVADIDRREVRNWFASLRATPAAADRSMPVLSVIMREAEAMGLRPEGSNPCRGIRRYRRKGRERFLSDDEIRRLAATLSAHAGRQPLQVRRQANIEDVRLHDLRHRFASHAMMRGVPVPVVSRLLGHSNVRMTLRYAHLGDREIEAAAERVGQSIGAIMGL